jgi:hypothetical protein
VKEAIEKYTAIGARSLEEAEFSRLLHDLIAQQQTAKALAALTPDAYRLAFEKFDRDGSGKIELSELLLALDALMPSHKFHHREADAVLSKYTAKPVLPGLDVAQFSELVRGLVVAQSRDAEAAVRAALTPQLLASTFEQFDADLVGTIALVELQDPTLNDVPRHEHYYRPGASVPADVAVAAAAAAPAADDSSASLSWDLPAAPAAAPVVAAPAAAAPAAAPLEEESVGRGPGPPVRIRDSSEIRPAPSAAPAVAPAAAPAAAPAVAPVGALARTLSFDRPPTLLRDPSEGALPTREVVTDADALHRSQTEEHDELVEKAAREALAPL